MTTTTVDPNTSTPETDVETLAARSAIAAEVWASTSRVDRSAALRAVADGLDAAVDDLVAIAGRETHLAEGRLRGELKRTTFQLRLFAELITDGGHLDVRVDHADPDWPMGAPRPDLRRVLEPIGPVLIFAASNFPFAFSVAGGDTASALAAGCSVILKAHPGHPELSAATGRIVAEALASVGAPADLFTLIYGTEAGVAALKAPEVKAASFTGSVAAGRTLFDIAAARPEPIPFFGELGSVNPVFVTRAADVARGPQIAADFIGSFTMGAGQFCTKPGVLLVPAGSTIIETLREQPLPAAVPLLNERIQAGYLDGLGALSQHPDVTVLAQGSDPFADPPTPTVLHTSVAALLADLDRLFRECFGPTVLVVSYTEEAELLAVARAIDGQLTATIVGEDADPIAPDLVRLLAKKAGRLLWNQWPTGVSVTYAQQHGGPYPATTSPGTTSVGTAAITRFLRPVAYQGFPQSLLPHALTDGAELPRQVDGVSVLSERS
jgi:NADP-dependent aldehyde dehydrogenase